VAIVAASRRAAVELNSEELVLWTATGGTLLTSSAFLIFSQKQLTSLAKLFWINFINYIKHKQTALTEIPHMNPACTCELERKQQIRQQDNSGSKKIKA
jgi:hypothetical protein